MVLLSEASLLDASYDENVLQIQITKYTEPFGWGGTPVVFLEVVLAFPLGRLLRIWHLDVNLDVHALDNHNFCSLLSSSQAYHNRHD
ncbi:MAG: hypothetical protein LBB42_05150 [Coriobacteriales bacterium]|nr:hypothetical protein [Coriobacteriales bacterium]